MDAVKVRVDFCLSDPLNDASVSIIENVQGRDGSTVKNVAQAYFADENIAAEIHFSDDLQLGR
jgi:hypothetical protein